MRVLAGTLKGQRIVTPKGRTTRPTADQVRIACLDTLMPYLEGGPFLDLFAGAGGVGIEALSRGAPSAVFVERDRQATISLDENIARLGLADRARVLRQDVSGGLATLEREDRRFAVVFLDPPYASPDGAAALEALARGVCLLPGAVVVAQRATKTPWGDATGVLRRWKDRRFGETTLTFFRGGA
jgi:16S rRNA (guanine966-N2)-methyltransferase